MSDRLNNVLDLLKVEDLGDGAFLGAQPNDDRERLRVYGGQVAGQAIAAAARTTSRRPHSMHLSFLRPGDTTIPLRYDVVSLREGRTFSTRRVTASQDGVVVMEAMASFIIDVDGDEYQQPMPEVPDPESLTPLDEQLREHLPADDDYLEMVAFRVAEMRYVDLPPRIAVDAPPREDPRTRIWLRLEEDPPAELLADPVLAVALLAYISDWTILDPVQIALGKTWQQLEKLASLDHAMWWHRPVDFADWLLYEQRTGTVTGGMGLGTGAIYNRDGSLVCTVTQEGFVGRRL
ncbi:acyl-CoA thioesterase II [Mycolicibacterium chitae]|uniref:Acyl-CoA thioesterase n=1 Tax=Mycolicibacterium chitae TaxID=1792 RepID=A0A448IAB5_MYCCI|nr:acyl-CoA thioesterase domain-containing protein [Mycolicibacterium chitae]MCV7106795.1 thioesterase family protein [Mycolicibacterium chitae]BBZ05748.1 acyl-CoA thioesterase II [Mycolicibacterium chitae]VEG49358.1 acyl-CoA thioesterase [Mycolicibacterium chitae]